MATTTPQQGFPVPTDDDDPNIPDDMSKLAQAIEKRVIAVYNNVTDRSTKVTSPQEGQVAYLKDTDAFTVFNGTEWVPMFQKPPAFTSGTTVPSNTTGADGDLFFKV